MHAIGILSSFLRKHSNDRGIRDLNHSFSEPSSRTSTVQFNASHMLRTSCTYISHVSQKRWRSPWSTWYAFSTSDRSDALPPQQPRSRSNKAP